MLTYCVCALLVYGSLAESYRDDREDLLASPQRNSPMRPMRYQSYENGKRCEYISLDGEDDHCPEALLPPQNNYEEPEYQLPPPPRRGSPTSRRKPYRGGKYSHLNSFLEPQAERAFRPPKPSPKMPSHRSDHYNDYLYEQRQEQQAQPEYMPETDLEHESREKLAPPFHQSSPMEPPPRSSKSTFKDYYQEEPPKEYFKDEPQSAPASRRPMHPVIYSEESSEYSKGPKRPVMRPQTCVPDEEECESCDCSG